MDKLLPVSCSQRVTPLDAQWRVPGGRPSGECPGGGPAESRPPEEAGEAAQRQPDVEGVLSVTHSQCLTLFFHLFFLKQHHLTTRWNSTWNVDVGKRTGVELLWLNEGLGQRRTCSASPQAPRGVGLRQGLHTARAVRVKPRAGPSHSSGRRRARAAGAGARLCHGAGRPCLFRKTRMMKHQKKQKLPKVAAWQISLVNQNFRWGKSFNYF